MATQKDCEEADIQKERDMQAKGPEYRCGGGQKERDMQAKGPECRCGRRKGRGC